MLLFKILKFKLIINQIKVKKKKNWSFLVAQIVKNLPAIQEGSIPRLERSPGEGSGNSLQYSCVENSMDRGVWWAIVHGVAKSWT